MIHTVNVDVSLDEVSLKSYFPHCKKSKNLFRNKGVFFIMAIKSPKETAQAFVGVGKAKANLSSTNMILLGILAGAYIGFGSELATMVGHDASKFVGVGLSKFMFGAVFSIGLMLVIIAGAELFTGNNLIFLGVCEGSVPASKMLKNWVLVYIGNFIGSILVAWLMYNTGLWKTANLAVGAKALNIAVGKVNLDFSTAFFRAIMCNWFVCLAVWMAIAAQDATGKIFSCFFIIMAFVASGFEHCVANMYFIPAGMFLKGNADVVATSGAAAEKLANLNFGGFMGNLIPVTLGNIVGGALLVGGIYYLIFIKPDKAQAASQSTNIKA